MHPDHDGDRFYLVPGARAGTLSLYGNRRFEHMARRRDWGDIPHEDQLTYDQIFFSMATAVEIDRQGRVLLPERVLKFVGIGREVVITGANDHLDLWNKSDYDAFMAENWPRYSELQRRLAARGGQGNGGQ